MRELTKKVSIRICDFSELPPQEQGLLRSAAEVRLHAIAPETHVWVGVALITESGKMYAGCNIERRSLSETLHAEQNAVNTMISSEGKTGISIIGVAVAEEGKFITIPPEIFGNVGSFEKITEIPCGKCLHIIWEHCRTADVKIITFLSTGEVAVTTIGDLLPLRFRKKAPCT